MKRTGILLVGVALLITAFGCERKKGTAEVLDEAAEKQVKQLEVVARKLLEENREQILAHEQKTAAVVDKIVKPVAASNPVYPVHATTIGPSVPMAAFMYQPYAVPVQTGPVIVYRPLTGLSDTEKAKQYGLELQALRLRHEQELLQLYLKYEPGLQRKGE